VPATLDRFNGQVIRPDDPDYDKARIVWNAMADRRPALIARCADVDDVVTAIRFAREKDLVVAVRGGGHSVAGFSTCDGGMVIDLSLMRGLTVDPERRIARAEGGAHLSQLDKGAQEFGLVCPVGVVGHTGVAGLTLGGGMGRLQRKFGLTVDNLLKVDLVTADGEKVQASETENADLFWGLRGAGANFGVATSFELSLHPMDGTVFQGGVAFPIDRSLEIAERVREFVATHEDTGAWLSFAKDEDRPVFIFGSTHADGIEKAEEDLRVFREAGPLTDWYGAKQYLAVQGMNDEVMGWGKRFYTKSGFFPNLADEIVEACASLTEAIPPDAELSLWCHGGAVGRVSNDAMATPAVTRRSVAQRSSFGPIRLTTRRGSSGAEPRSPS
jgi:FAD/FMN-containing dehydrogenase